MGCGGLSRAAHRRCGASRLLEGDVAETTRAAAIVRDERVDDFTVFFKVRFQNLRVRREHAVGEAGIEPRGAVVRRTLPLTDHGRLEQKSCVFENGRSFRAVLIVPVIAQRFISNGSGHHCSTNATSEVADRQRRSDTQAMAPDADRGAAGAAVKGR